MLLSLDFCADILAKKEFEHIVKDIFHLSIGSWTPLHELILLEDYSYVGSVIHVSWSESLWNEEGFRLILFCDEEDMEMLTATYNIGYLFRELNSDRL